MNLFLDAVGQEQQARGGPLNWPDLAKSFGAFEVGGL